MNKTCPHSQLLQRFMDGELPEQQIRFVEHHLEGCAHCDRELQSLTRLKNLLLDLDDVEASPGFDRAFWKKVDAFEEKRLPSLFRRWMAGRWRLGLAPVLATLILFGGVTLVRKTQSVPVTDVNVLDQMDLFSDYDVVSNLDVLEQVDRELRTGEL